MRVRVSEDQRELVVEEATPAEYSGLREHLTRRPKGWQFEPAYRYGFKEGETFFHDGRIPIGLWKECREYCEGSGFGFSMSNFDDFPLERRVTRESYSAWCDEFFAGRKSVAGADWFPMAHQIEESYKLIRARYATTEVATSGGKSLIMSMVIFHVLHRLEPGAKFLVVVPSVMLVSQLYDDIQDFAGGYMNEASVPLDLRVTELMAKQNKPRVAEDANVYIATFQTLGLIANPFEKADDAPVKAAKGGTAPEKKKKKKRAVQKGGVSPGAAFFEQFDGVIVDESHSAKCDTVQNVLGLCGSARWRVGLSGTYHAKDSLDWLKVQSVLGPKVGVVRADELMALGIVSPIKIYAVRLNHCSLGLHASLAELRKSDGLRALNAEVEHVQTSERRLAYMVARIGAVTKNTLVLFKNHRHGLALLEMATREHGDTRVLHYIDESVKKSQRDLIKADMEVVEPGKPRVLIATFDTLGTGVSIKAIFNLFLVDSTRSEVKIRQFAGRGLRLHTDKERLTVLDFVDVYEDVETKKPKNVLYSHALERQRIYDEQNYPYEVVDVLLP